MVSRFSHRILLLLHQFFDSLSFYSSILINVSMVHCGSRKSGANERHFVMLAATKTLMPFLTFLTRAWHFLLLAIVMIIRVRATQLASKLRCHDATTMHERQNQHQNDRHGRQCGRRGPTQGDLYLQGSMDCLCNGVVSSVGFNKHCRKKRTTFGGVFLTNGAVGCAITLF